MEVIFLWEVVMYFSVCFINGLLCFDLSFLNFNVVSFVIVFESLYFLIFVKDDYDFDFMNVNLR